MIVNGVSVVVIARRSPAKSETRNQWWPSSLVSASAAPGICRLSNCGIDGDWVGPPPRSLAKNTPAR